MTDFYNNSLTEVIDELTAFQPNGFPFISLYLNAQADQHGRDNFGPFVRKALSERSKTFAYGSPDRECFERDAGRIIRYLREELHSSANGLAVFACAGANNYFKVAQLKAPIETNELHVSKQPHIYPLAQLIDRNPRFVVLLANAHLARLFVFELGEVKRSKTLNNTGKSLAKDGMFTQLRNQRRVDNFNTLHAKEVVAMLERVVREEEVEHIILAGDNDIIPLLREQMPKHTADKVIDVLRLDVHTPEHEILNATIDALRDDNIRSDAEKVKRFFNEYGSGGLAAADPREISHALAQGRVNELLVSSPLEKISIGDGKVGRFKSKTLTSSMAPTTKRVQAFADDLIGQAHRTGAAVTFIEDPELLASIGGVGAFLRY